MKRIFGVLAVLAVAIAMAMPAHAQTPPLGANTQIIATWTPVSGYPFCGATMISACLLGYTETITPPAGVSGTDVIPSCSATVTANCIGPGSGTYAWAPGGNLYCGTWTISLVTNYLDGNGSPGVSTPPATVSAVEPCPFVSPGSPKSVSASFK